MKVQTQLIGQVLVAQLSGEIDTVDTDGLGSALADIVATTPPAVVLDFSHVSYIASIGLSLLLKLAQDLRRTKSRLVIAAASPAVKTVLDTVHLGAVVPMELTVEAAVARVAA